MARRPGTASMARHVRSGRVRNASRRAAATHARCVSARRAQARRSSQAKLDSRSLPVRAGAPPRAVPRPRIVGTQPCADAFGVARVLRLRIEGDRTLGDNPCAGIKAPKSPKRLPSALTPDEAVRLVEIPRGRALDVRDRALLELAYSSGLRLSELASLDVGGVDSTTARARARQGLEGARRSGRAAAREAIGRGSRSARRWSPCRRRMFVGPRGRRMSARRSSGGSRHGR